MALRTLDASVVETLKRTIALVVSLAAGRALFGESITRSKVAAVTLMIGGTLLVMAD
jgi:multidrug transporter EmrE-like cation transporter